MKKIILMFFILTSLSFGALNEPKKNQLSHELNLNIIKEENKTLKSPWVLKGSKIVFKNNIYNSSNNLFLVNNEDDTDIDLFLVVEKKVNDYVSLYLKWDTSDDNCDKTIDFEIKTKFTKQLEAQLGMDIELETVDEDGNKIGGISITENRSKKKTYIKYKVNDKFTYSVHPFDISLKLGNEFELKGCQVVKVPGIIFYNKLNENISFETALGGKTTTNLNEKAPENEEAIYGAKFCAFYKSKDLKLNLAFSANNEKDEFAYKRPVKYASDLSASYSKDKLFLTSEIFAVKTIDFSGKLSKYDTVKTTTEAKLDFGIFIKGQYQYGKITENFDLAPFISYKKIGKNLYFDDNDSLAEHGGIDKYNLGCEFINGYLVISPGIEFDFAGEEYYSGEKTQTLIYTEFKVEI